jgi:hypothetical protein
MLVPHLQQVGIKVTTYTSEDLRFLPSLAAGQTRLVWSLPCQTRLVLSPSSGTGMMATRSVSKLKHS